MTIEITRNTDERLSLPYRRILTEVVSAVLAAEHFPEEADVSVTFTDDRGIRELNREFRGIDRETDVLSFPMLAMKKPRDYRRALLKDAADPETGGVVLGDIVLNICRIRSQAKEYGHSQKRELAFLTAHSMLHLLGYDHMEEKERAVMEERQRSILNDCGYTR